MVTRRLFLKASAGLSALACAPACAAAAQSGTPARYWHALDGGRVACELCPQACALADGVSGVCRVRVNHGGRLFTSGYANPCAVHVDPIEKKPFFHVLPGTTAFSIAVAGCNLRCKNCQNYTISQASPLDTRNEHLPPAAVVERAVKSGCASIAYTYSEPTVWFEYMYDTARLARQAGLKNVLVTSGFINLAPLRDLAQYMDAATIDIKSASDESYRRLNAGRLQPVLDAVKQAKAAGIFVEASTLVVPQWTDGEENLRKLCDWVASTLGVSTPMHFLRFHPMHELAQLPPTPTATLDRAAAIARAAGLSFVYIGNVAEADLTTYCPSCRKPLVKRMGYIVQGNDVVKGACRFCGAGVPGIWQV